MTTTEGLLVAAGVAFAVLAIYYWNTGATEYASR